ncbi:elongation factor G [Fluviispira multicolorata]|uniref:Elongation factor G n=1 Tax=Fluviispira multicolorata TaxID=2654512 RepID=A0A833N803_9BACT|nr:elongation factor G [Fluviispira multicolorata]KAB8033506.1 elongation factor G [Fluviispira multicolorata]
MTIKDLSHVRNIGISAHIDSGKTTLSERILFYTGKIHKIEEVKGKSGVGATMDHMDLEREKGITIQSAATFCQWRETWINLIDTPGHVDFTVEVERSLRVLDGAILVLCSVAGVQSQSITVDRQMRRYRVPRIAFVNKMDRPGANPYRVCQQLREKLNHNAWMAQMPIGAEDRFQGVVDLLSMKAFYFDGANGENVREEEIPVDMIDEAKSRRSDLIGALADFDDVVAEKFLSDEFVTLDEATKAMRKAVISLQFTPVFCGSAFKNKGVQVLLDAVTAYLPAPNEVSNEALDQTNNEERVPLKADPNLPLVMLAFKLDETRYGQLTFMRIYQGTVKKGEMITNMSSEKRVKVPRIVRLHSDDMEDIDEASAGDIVALFGVDCASGDTFTDGKLNVTMASMYVPNAVITLAIAPKDKTAQTNFSKALNKFTKEDPTFRVSRDEESGETIIAGMGELHLEIYVERMKREFGCETIVGKPQVNFREALTSRAEINYTHKKQSGGSGQFARIIGFMEPLVDAGDKVYEFEDDTVGGSIPRQFIPACEKGFVEQLKTGLLIGAQVVGVKLVVNDGLHHPVDSNEMAFKTCAMTGFRESYMSAKPVILEPIMKVGIEGPEEFQGTMMGLINQRRGVIMGTAGNGGYCQIEAEVPLTEMFGFSTDLRSGTQGKGEFSMEFAKYAAVPRNVQEDMVAKYKAKRAAENK